MAAEKEIEVFIECISNYFHKRSDRNAKIGTPYLIENIEKVISDYTGIISISGNYQGYILFTAPKDFLVSLIASHNQSDFSDHLLEDVIGEVTNTLSGNARKHLGGQFVISVPSVMQESWETFDFNNTPRSFVIPLEWSNKSASMIASIFKI